MRTFMRYDHAFYDSAANVLPAPVSGIMQANTRVAKCTSLGMCT